MNNTMKRLLLSVWLLSLSLLSAVAENYPYKSDVLWVTVPNHADWLYKTGEKVTVEVQFYKYGIPRDNVTVTYEIGGDMMPVADTKGSITLKNGRGVIPVGTMKEPGFRDCRLKATVDGKTYSHHIKVGFHRRNFAHIQPCLPISRNFGKRLKRNKRSFP